MPNALAGSLTLIDTSGQLILAAIFALLTSSLGSTWFIRNRYRAMERELREHTNPSLPFTSRLLNRIARDVSEAQRRGSGAVDAQIIVENRFQSDVPMLVVGERFVKASTGLAIILGLVGTFYGLTSAIGRLVGLVAGDSHGGADVTQVITQGLTQALSGMSIAFSCSLFGILAAILMTLAGVFFNVADRRTRLMVQIEAYVDALLRSEAQGSTADGTPGSRSGGRGDARTSGRVELALGDFAQTVSRLEASVAAFDSALQGFAKNTRDFQEFNLHLKDNIQRMSLTFADLSDSLKTQVVTPKSRVQP